MFSGGIIVSVEKLTALGKSSPATGESTAGGRVRAVPKWLFAEAMLALLALVTLAINMKLMTWLATDRAAK
jgi:hypothetical protein